MIHLTVGYVAGLLAAAIFAARIWSPNAITFILSGILRNSNSAATWTAASSALQRSHWPTVLRSDSALNHGVRKDILILTWVISAMSFLIAVAGIVTPLGLYETLVTTQNTYAPFEYVNDPSSFGFGTPPRSELPFNRICHRSLVGVLFWTPWPCPFTSTVAITKQDKTWYNVSYTSKNGGYENLIPASLAAAYSSGTNNKTTISNYFDIEWRRYQTTFDGANGEINNGSVYLVGSSRNMESYVLHDTVEPIEGLLIDTQNGSIAFRNHTVPKGYIHGATWEEELLFIEPETVCINTNVTVDYEISGYINSSARLANVTLTDRGGFANLPLKYPKIDLTNPQADPKLAERAYKAAWMVNAYTMAYLNVTNPANETTGKKAFQYLNTSVGKTFDLPNQGSSGDYDSMSLLGTWYGHLGTFLATTNGSINPFNIQIANFSDISLICSGAGGADYANITNIFVKCGLLRGVPERVGPGSSILFDAGSRWSQPIFACASAAKSTVKTVEFTYKGSGGLQGLKVNKVKPKVYNRKPLWGVENTGNAFKLTDIELLWGLVADKYENHPNVSTVRQDSFYLPGYPDSASEKKLDLFSLQNTPASNFYKVALNIAYSISSSSTYSGSDYSGSSNMAHWAKWQNLSRNADTAAKIPGLVWADFAAASVVGTKGILGHRNEASNNVIPILVSPVESRIRYHMPFAIPAVLALMGLALMTLAALATVVFKKHNIEAMRFQLQSLSPGRIFTTFLHPELGGMNVPSRDWGKTTGNTVIDITGGYPFSANATSGATTMENGAENGKGPHVLESLLSKEKSQRD